MRPWRPSASVAPASSGVEKLEVRQDACYSTIAGRRIDTGAYLSINGTDGSVYEGEHPTTLVERQGLA